MTMFVNESFHTAERSVVWFSTSCLQSGPTLVTEGFPQICSQSELDSIIEVAAPLGKPCSVGCFGISLCSEKNQDTVLKELRGRFPFIFEVRAEFVGFCGHWEYQLTIMQQEENSFIIELCSRVSTS